MPQPVTNDPAPALDFTMDVPINGEVSDAELYLAQQRQNLNNAKALETLHTADAQALTDHLNDATDAHDASAISFAAVGTVSSTTVQAAIAELDTEKATTGSVAAVNARLETAGDIDSRIDALETSPLGQIGKGVSFQYLSNHPTSGAEVQPTLSILQPSLLDPIGFQDSGFTQPFTGQIEIPVAGRYLISASGVTQNPSAGQVNYDMFLKLYQVSTNNTSTVSSKWVRTDDNLEYLSLMTTVAMLLVAGDRVFVSNRITNKTGLAVNGEFSIIRIG